MNTIFKYKEKTCRTSKNVSIRRFVNSSTFSDTLKTEKFIKISCIRIRVL